MSEKKYWKNFGELNLTDSYIKDAENEFREDLPMEASLEAKGILDAKTPRRDFLKYLGFSTAAATLAASCEMPVRHIVPYINRPENIVPGVADYYATTFTQGGDAVSVVAKVRDGRPIKLEGNELSPVTQGGTSAQVQASILDLYDTARLRYPVQMVGGVPQEVTSFEAFDKLVMDSMTAAGQNGITVLLTPTITSVTSKQIIADALSKYPGSRHVQYDADSYSGILQANEAAYGKRAIPSYHFDQAKVIVSLGADFLGTWISPIEYARQYAVGRKIDEKVPVMNRHYHFESFLSLTGANADERFSHKPSETGAVALALLAAVGGSVTTPTLPEKLKAGVQAAAKDLMVNKGKALVVSGSNNVQVQIIVNAINEALGANGTTISWDAINLTRQGIDADFAALVNDMNQGNVKTLLVYDVNPVYDNPDSKKFISGLAKVKTTVSFSGRLDETTELCKYILPSPHFLERWGDAEPRAGHISLMQPVIAPLFLTRPFEDTLLVFSGSKTGYDEYFKQYWTNKLGGYVGYEKALQDGVIEHLTATAAIPSATTPYVHTAGNIASAAAAVSVKAGGEHELVLYQQVNMGIGAQANNPWLLEMPDPITRASWDNYAMVSPNFIKEQYGIDLSNRNQSDKYESHPERQVIKIKKGGNELTIPVIAVPGMTEGVFAIALGYGRQSADPKNTESFIGRAAVGAGKNVFPFASYNGSTVEWMATDVSFEKTSDAYKVAQEQVHGSYEGRTSVIKELTLAEFVKEPEEILKDRKDELAKFGGIEEFDKEGTLYPYYDKPGLHWGMSIDLNSCVGCGACTIACIAENNVPIVGKGEVLRYHDMHWLRIDRYFTGSLDDPNSIQTVFQPMLCQHCDNAPCENVCPVAATNHSTEGLNQMAYNRCIGTRYCANNCPFKVRRFNWEDYTGADSFPNNQDENGVGKLSDAVLMMNEDLPRMVLNPDVTVRSRGVMEKCSFCVQRLQDGKLKAKKESRVLSDDDVKTACQQACPTHAIVFGNVNNSKSEVVKTRQENEHRLYHVLEELHVLPNITYFAKVRNPESEAKEKA
jgi:MoCo/4Fe-4S cofactor protein with predicted Tat translocation signal